MNDEENRSRPSTTDSRNHEDKGSETGGNITQTGKGKIGRNLVQEWEDLEKKFLKFKKKMTRKVFDKLENLENLRYKNLKRRDEITQKIQEDWNAFEQDVQYAIKTSREAREKRKAEFKAKMEAKKEDINNRMKTWKKNYQNWVARIQRRAWMFFIKFLVVVIPIIIIFVIIAGVFN
ncbi:hypothetical protein GF325_09185 [Candidatus Bathyarchaeota archaeon]|nr:hypothetical protein [Candidatus Bathyarchaeota archaeon]